MKCLKFAVFIAVIFSLGVHAQEQQAMWEVVVFASGENAILILTPEGVAETLPLPEDVYGNLALSPNHRFLAFDRSQYEGAGETVYLADLENQVCCTMPMPEDVFQGMESITYRVIGFNPKDSSQLALLYGALPENSPEFSPFDPTQYGFMIFNVETGELVAETRTPTPGGQAFGWSEYGIIWGERPFVMEGDFAEPFYIRPARLWKPGSIEQEASPYFCISSFTIDCGDFSELSGEQIVRGYVDMFPDEPSDIYFQVIFYQDGNADAPNPPVPQPIFVDNSSNADDSLQRNVYTARWIADGNAIFIRLLGQLADRNAPIILRRDGSIESVSVAFEHEFLTGTPDGWIAYDIVGSPLPNDTMHFYHYRYSQDGLEMSIIAEFPALPDGRRWQPVVLQRTPLGATVEDIPFPNTPIPRGLG